MQSAEAPVRIVVLTEDTNKDARVTVEALVRRMLPLVVPNCRIHDCVTFLPTDPREQEAMHGEAWKSDKQIHREARVRLQRYIARRLCEPQTFVVFHVDGDKPWQERHESDNKRKFDAFIVLVAQSADAGQRNVQRARQRPSTESNTLPVPDLDNLIRLMPFYTLEAWLYQNIQGIVDICRRQHDGKHVDAACAWEAVRHELDELVKPAEYFRDCVAKMHNHELATSGFPTQKAYDVRKSFFESVERMKACAKLVAALESTVPVWS